MNEVNIRKSRNGETMLQQDNVLTKYYSDSHRPEELTWAELSKLKSTPGGKPPLHFEELCAMCKGRMRLMLDMKGEWEPGFYQRLLRCMVDGGIPGPTYSLGGPRVRPFFDGEVMVSVNRNALREAAEAGEPVAERYFLFELGSELDQEAIAFARKLQVSPVAAINTFRYTMAKRDEWDGPKQDINRLRALDVKLYQVDSRYEELFG